MNLPTGENEAEIKRQAELNQVEGINLSIPNKVAYPGNSIVLFNIVATPQFWAGRGGEKETFPLQAARHRFEQAMSWVLQALRNENGAVNAGPIRAAADRFSQNGIYKIHETFPEFVRYYRNVKSLGRQSKLHKPLNDLIQRNYKFWKYYKGELDPESAEPNDHSNKKRIRKNYVDYWEKHLGPAPSEGIHAFEDLSWPWNSQGNPQHQQQPPPPRFLQQQQMPAAQRAFLSHQQQQQQEQGSLPLGNPQLFPQQQTFLHHQLHMLQLSAQQQCQPLNLQHPFQSAVMQNIGTLQQPGNQNNQQQMQLTPQPIQETQQNVSPQQLPPPQQFHTDQQADQTNDPSVQEPLPKRLRTNSGAAVSLNESDNAAPDSHLEHEVDQAYSPAHHSNESTPQAKFSEEEQPFREEDQSKDQSQETVPPSPTQKPLYPFVALPKFPPEAGDVDIPDLPTGTAVKWRYDTDVNSYCKDTGKSAVLIADLRGVSKSEITDPDRIFFWRLLQRDDLTLVFDGICEGVDQNTILSELEKGMGGQS